MTPRCCAAAAVAFPVLLQTRCNALSQVLVRCAVALSPNEPRQPSARGTRDAQAAFASCPCPRRRINVSADSPPPPVPAAGAAPAALV